LIVRFGAARIPGHHAGWRSALNELSTAAFDIHLDEAEVEPIDYVAGADIKIDGEDAWAGSVVTAVPLEAKIHVECTSGVEMTESVMGAMGSEECPIMDLGYAIARSAGFSEENTEISHLDKLPLESIEVVVALEGVRVPGRRGMGPVTLVSPEQGLGALDAFDRDQLPSSLREAFERADCFAVVVVTASRLWDAENAALSEVDTVLGWMATRARFGLARLPDGQAQRYEREVTRSLPRRGGAMVVRALGTRRRWVRDPGTLIERPTLELDDLHGQLAPDLPAVVDPSDRLALAAARRSFEGDPVQRVVALWEAFELYGGSESPPPVFEEGELERLKTELPSWLKAEQVDRLEGLFKLANNLPLRRTLKEALARDGVPIGKSEWKALWKLRRIRNRTVHGATSGAIDERELERACSLLSRALVYRLRGRPRYGPALKVEDASGHEDRPHL
jgi:hypothetical protein